MDLYVLLQAVPLGGYISGFKIGTLLVLCLIWWRLLTWIDKDAPAARLPREVMNSAMVGACVLALVLFFILPNFWIGFAAFMVLMLGSFGAYLAIRNKQVGLKDLGDEIRNIKLFGGKDEGKKKKKKKTDEGIGGRSALTSKDGRPLIEPEDESPDRSAYDIVQVMVTEPLRRNMERLELAAVEGGVVTQYWVDGVMFTGPQFERQGANAAITMLKRLAGLDMNEKRKPQTGIIQATIEGKRHEVQVHTAGSAAGESLRLMVDAKRRHELKLEALGLSADQLQQVETAVRDRSGVVLLAVPRGQGLTSLAYAIIRRHDAFLSHILSIERDPEDDLEGITQNKLARGASPNDEFQQVQWVISQEPDALLMAEIANPKSARDLVQYAADGKRVYVGLRAGSAVDAISEWRQMVGDDDLATKSLRQVISGRLVRKLCPACKQPYQPEPETLRKLNLDHGRAQQFFQARTQPLVDQKGNPIVCTFCAEMRYRGRTGVYEVMDINDEVRQAIMANSQPNQLRALFRKMRGRFIQELALDLVEKGETSIQEVLRSMRGQEQDPRGGTAPGGTATGTFGPGGSSPGPGKDGTRSGSASGSGTRIVPGSRPGRPQTPGR